MLSESELAGIMKEIRCEAETMFQEKHDAVVSIHLQDSETFEAWKDILPFYQNVVRYGIAL